MVTIDYPHLRKSTQCPFCKGPKATGLIACWPCFQGHGLRNGETFEQRLILEYADQISAQQ